ncbi:Protein Y57G11C.20 [Aphelenchoides avenae]|nr:Protein Y57G11C.20 [Aphelenchus avenae]
MRFNSSEIKYIAMSNQMYYVLGYRRTQKVRDGDVAEHPPDIQGGISHLAIYTNIIQPVVVGDCMSQLLRIVSVTGKHGDNVERIFDSPLYCNVSARDVSKISIDIRTLDNQPVLFSTGNVICTLLFRKVSLI